MFIAQAGCHKPRRGLLAVCSTPCQGSRQSLNTSLLANCAAMLKSMLALWMECHCLHAHNVVLASRDNLQQAMRADAEVDRKIEINMQNFEALDFNAAASKSGMRPGDAFGSTIRGAAPGLRQGKRS